MNALSRATALLLLPCLLLGGAPAFAQSAPPAAQGAPPAPAGDTSTSQAAEPDQTGSKAAAPTDTTDWTSRDRPAMVGFGVYLLALAVAGGVGGYWWYKEDGQPACDAGPGLRCEKLYNSKLTGALAMGLALEAAIAGSVLIWTSRTSFGQVAVSPAGISGRF